MLRSQGSVRRVKTTCGREFAKSPICPLGGYTEYTSAGFSAKRGTGHGKAELAAVAPLGSRVVGQLLHGLRDFDLVLARFERRLTPLVKLNLAGGESGLMFAHLDKCLTESADFRVGLKIRFTGLGQLVKIHLVQIKGRLPGENGEHRVPPW
jgi:hypothetical protein